jgi:hypothetical protein
MVRAEPRKEMEQVMLMQERRGAAALGGIATGGV